MGSSACWEQYSQTGRVPAGRAGSRYTKPSAPPGFPLLLEGRRGRGLPGVAETANASEVVLDASGVGFGAAGDDQARSGGCVPLQVPASGRLDAPALVLSGCDERLEVLLGGHGVSLLCWGPVVVGLVEKELCRVFWGVKEPACSGVHCAGGRGPGAVGLVVRVVSVRGWDGCLHGWSLPPRGTDDAVTGWVVFWGAAGG